MESNSPEPPIAPPESSLGLGPLESSTNSPNSGSPNIDTVINSRESKHVDPPKREDSDRCDALLLSIEDLVQESDQKDPIFTDSDANALTEHDLEDALPEPDLQLENHEQEQTDPTFTDRQHQRTKHFRNSSDRGFNRGIERRGGGPS